MWLYRLLKRRKFEKYLKEVNEYHKNVVFKNNPAAYRMWLEEV